MERPMTPDEFVTRILTENDADELAAALVDAISDLDGDAVRAWIGAVVDHPAMRPPVSGTGPWGRGVGANPYVSIRVENGSGASVIIDHYNTQDSRRVASEIRNVIGQDVHGARITVQAVKPGAGKHPRLSESVRLAVETALKYAKGQKSRFRSPSFERLDKINGEACKDPRFRAAMSRAAKKDG